MTTAGAVLAVHLVSMSIFIGSITVVLLGKIYAERPENLSSISVILGLLIFIDQRATGPSAAVLTVTGILLVPLGGWDLVRQTWLQALVVLWAGSAVAAHKLLLPRLRTLRQMAESHGASGRYRQKARQWNVVSGILLLVQLLAITIATLKPTI